MPDVCRPSLHLSCGLPVLEWPLLHLAQHQYPHGGQPSTGEAQAQQRAVGRFELHLRSSAGRALPSLHLKEICNYSSSHSFAGINKEFLFVGRLDNLCSSWYALAALLDSYPTEAELADESCIKAVALFDHEEVCSASAQGAVLRTLKLMGYSLGSKWTE